MADELDPNQLAHNIVTKATGDEPTKCPECGLPMEQRTEYDNLGRFGSEVRDVRRARTFYVCRNGHEVRSS
jgi:hypothetical protein